MTLRFSRAFFPVAACAGLATVVLLALSLDSDQPESGGVARRLSPERVPGASRTALSSNDEVPPPQAPTVGAIPGDQVAQITCVVRNAQGSPLSGVIVHAQVRQGQGSHVRLRRVTGPGGQFTIPGAPKGEAVAIRLEHEGYAPLTTEVGDVCGAVNVLTMGCGATVRGRVCDSTGQGVRGAKVVLVPVGSPSPLRKPLWGKDSMPVHLAEATTDQLGKFVLRGLPVPLEIRAYASCADGREGRTSTLSLSTPESDREVRIAVAHVGSVSIALRSAGDGEPLHVRDFHCSIGGPWMDVEDDLRARPSSAHGISRVEGVPEGVHLLHVTHHSYVSTGGFLVPRPVRVVVLPGAETHVEVDVETGCKVSGRVHLRDEAPADAVVECESVWRGVPQFSRTQTRPDGTFTLAGVPRSRGTIRVTGLTVEARSVAVESLESWSGEVRVQRLPCIEGRILELSRACRPRAWVVTSGDTFECRTQFDDAGSFRAEGLPADRKFDLWIVCSDDGAILLRGLQLQVEEVRHVGVVPASALMRLQGQVLDEFGRGVQGAHVVGVHPWASARAETDTEGNFDLGEITAGPITLRVWADDLPTVFHRLSDTRSSSPLRIHLPRPAVLRVCLIRTNGEPALVRRVEISRIVAGGRADWRLSQRGRTDEYGVATFHVEPGIYAVRSWGNSWIAGSEPLPEVHVGSEEVAECRVVIR